MAVVQRYPQGLLEILGMKGTGDVPSQLANSYVGTLSIMQMLTRTNITRTLAANAAAVQGNTVIVTVPQNEVWTLGTLNVRIPEQAAMTVVSTSVTVNRAGQPSVVASERWSALSAGPFVAGGNLFLTWSPDEAWVLLPGETIVAALTTLAGVANAGLNLNVVAGVFT
jgi:hypothetical protein